MRRLFNKQATVTPFQAPETHYDQSVNAGYDEQYAPPQQTHARNKSVPLQYRDVLPSRPHAAEHPTPLRAAGGAGYPSYGGERTSAKSNVSRKGSLNTTSRSSPVRQHYHGVDAREAAYEQTAARSGPYTRASQYDSYPDATQHLNDSSARVQYDAIPARPKPITDPLPNPYDTTGTSGLHRRVSSTDHSAHRTRRQHGHPPSRQSYDNMQRRYSQTSDSDSGYPMRSARHERHDSSTERRAPYATARYSSHENLLNVPRSHAAEGIHDGRRPSVERPQDRYVDSFDEANSSTGKIGAQDGAKKKVRRMIFGLHRKQREPDSASDVEHSKRPNEAGWDEGEGVDYYNASGRTSAEPKSGRSSPKKLANGLTAGEAKPHNWPDWKALGGKAKAGGKAEEGVVTQQVGWLCAQDERHWVADNVTPLYDAISHSEAAAKEAARALRKEFKYGTEDAQYCAIKLWAMAFVHSSDRFRLQLANKRFLEVVEDLYGDKRTPTKTRGRLLVACSMLAYQSQADEDLQSITKMYNKIKPADMPLNGVAIDYGHDLFRTGDVEDEHAVQGIGADAEPFDAHIAGHGYDAVRDRSSQAHAVPPQFNSTVPVNTVTAQNAAQAALELHNQRPFVAMEQATQHSEELRRLHEECTVARSNAHVLVETLVEDGLEGTLLPEFSQKTRSSQEFLSGQIPWASSQAEQSRQLANNQQQHVPGLTAEETLLNDLLDAHEKVAAAQSMLDEAHVRRHEEEEEAQVLERSMREMRMDRSTLIHDAETGYAYQVDENERSQHNGNAIRASGSRSASPVRGPLPPAPNAMQTHAYSGAFLAPPMQASLSTASAPTSGGSPYGSSQHGLGRSGTTSSSPAAPGELYSPAAATVQPARRPNVSVSVAAANGHTNDPNDDESDIMTPIQPSEKALGKRRAVSVDVTEPSLMSVAVATESSNGGSTALNAAPASEGATDREGLLFTRPPPALPPR